MGFGDDPIVDEMPTPSFGNDPVVEPTSPTTPEPSMGQVAMNAVPKGLANLMNTPITLANLIMMGIANLPGAGHLQGLQAAAAEPELKANAPMDVAKQAGLVDPNKEPQTGPQRIVDTAIQAAIASAAVPAGGVLGAVKGAAVGATSGAAAQTTKEATRDFLGETGSSLLAVAVGVATPLAISAATNRTKTILGTDTRKQTLKEAQDVGYVVEPSSVRQPTSKLETIAGKASIAQEAAIRNQAVTNKLAAKAIGLPEETPLTMGTLEELRDRVSAPYREVAELSPVAKQALDKLQQTRFDASEQWNFYKRTGNPEAGKLARSLSARAEAYETVIDREAKKVVEVYGKWKATPVAPVMNPKPGLPAGTSPAQIETREVGFPLPATGKEASSQAGARTINLEKVGETTAGAPDLLIRLRSARQLLARTHDVEKALNLGDGNVSAVVIGRLLDQGKPLTGELKIIGKFAQAFPRVAREVAGVPPSGVSGTDAASAALLGTVGAAGAGPAGLVAGGAPLLRGPARNYVLSEAYQKGLLYEPTNIPAGVTAGRAAMVGTTLEDQP